MSNNRILFFPSNVTAAQAMIPTAEYFGLHGADAQFLVAHESVGRLLLHRGIESDRLHMVRPNRLSAAWMLFRLIRYGAAALRCPETYIRAEMRSLCRDYARTLRRLAPAGVVLYGDRVYNSELPAVSACRKMGIPSFVHPPVMGSRRASLRSLREKCGGYNATGCEVLAQRFPACVSHYEDGVSLFFYQSVYLRPLSDLGLLPANPWILGGGGSDYVFAASLSQVEDLRQERVPSAKVVPTGFPEHDRLYALVGKRQEIRAAVMRKYRLAPEKRLVVFSPPHLWEHNVMDRDLQFREIRRIAEQVKASDVNFIVSLHPKCKRECYDFLEREYGAVILDEMLVEVLAGMDALVTLDRSSVLLLALLCGVEAIGIGYLLEPLHLYERYGMITCYTIEEIFDALNGKAAASSAEGGEKMDVAEDYLFDGNASRRVFEFIMNKIAGKSAS